MKDNIVQTILQPNEAIDLIVTNNPEAVFRNMMLKGYHVKTVEEFWDVVDVLASSPQGVYELMEILDVPLIESAMPPDYVQAVYAIVQDQTTPGAKSFLGMTGEEWNNTLGAVAAAALPVLLASMGQGGQPDINQPPYTPPPKDNTLMIVSIVGGLLVLGIILALILTKKK